MSNLKHLNKYELLNEIIHMENRIRYHKRKINGAKERRRWAKIYYEKIKKL